MAAPDRKQVLLRLDPSVHDALQRWAGDELRSLNSHIEWIMRNALKEAGRLPTNVRPAVKRGRPRKAAPLPDEDSKLIE